MQWTFLTHLLVCTNYLSKWLYNSTFLPVVCVNTCFSTTSPDLKQSDMLIFAKWIDVRFSLSLICISLVIKWAWASFDLFIYFCHSYSPLCFPFIYWIFFLLICSNTLYILGIFIHTCYTQCCKKNRYLGKRWITKWN